MSDIPQDAPAGPSLDVERLTADHEKFKASLYNEHDPSSVLYRRPDLAQAKRAELDLQFQGMLARSGASLPPPPTPESIAAAAHAETWKWLDAGLPAFVTDLQAAADEAASKMSQGVRENAEQAMITDAGTQRYEELRAAHQLPYGVDKAYFVKTEGERRVKELVSQAEATLKPGEKLSPGVLVDGNLLVNLAAHGRSLQARAAAKARLRT